MRKQPPSLVTLLVVVAFIAAGCSGSDRASSASPTTPATSASAAPTPAEPTSEAEEVTNSDVPADSDTSQDTVAFEDTFVSFGNPDAQNVIVVAQGGPIPVLDTDEAQAIFGDFNLDEVHIVLPHQSQTLDPEAFLTDEISFEQAKASDGLSTAMLADVVQYHLDQDHTVGVVGISFGAFVVQDLLATQGNVADGYLIQVGRLDMPAEVWEPFSEGRFVGFTDGVEVEQVDADGAGMGGETATVDSNMAKLAAGLGHKRYTELLADVDLSNVVYAYGEIDEQVGRLSPAELSFLDTKGVHVLANAGGHGGAIDATLVPGLEILFGEESEGLLEPVASTESQSSEDIGYLAVAEVHDYVAAYERGLAASSVTIDDEQLPVSYAGIESGITINVDGGAVFLELGDEDLEGAQVEWEDVLWVVQEAPEITAIPEPLGGEGSVIAMSFSATSTEDPADSLDVELTLDINVIGMGASVVEVTDGYATISGTLGTSTYIQVADVIAKNPEVDTLVMINVNGSENDEINVHTARLIRAAGWTTWVPANGDISSGGVDMFVAGVHRIVEPGGFVGVHSWGAEPGEPTGRDYPADSNVHRSQLEYFTEMMGDQAGPEFYFYTLEASPFEQIYRMTPAEIDEYGLATTEAPGALPETVTGLPAGYLELAEGTYLKLQVLSCAVDGAEVSAQLSSAELGPIEIATSSVEREVSFPSLEGLAPVDHEITSLTVEGDVLSGTADLDFEAVIGLLDTSNASFVVPCAG